MLTLLPLSEHVPWSVTGTGTADDGSIEDVTIVIDRGAHESRCFLRTMRRTGLRLGPRSSVHGQVTDAVTTAALAVGSLLLAAIPEGLPHHEAIAAMREAEARSAALASERDEWRVAALTLDGADYALFTRAIPEGTVAHADLGWATIALWSAGPLSSGPFRLADLDRGTGLSDR